MRLAEILPAGTAGYKSVLALLKSGADDGAQPSWLCPEIVSFSESICILIAFKHRDLGCVRDRHLSSFRVGCQQYDMLSGTRAGL